VLFLIETNAALIKKAMPSARLGILRDIGHLPHIEVPEQVNRCFEGVSEARDSGRRQLPQ